VMFRSDCVVEEGRKEREQGVIVRGVDVIICGSRAGGVRRR
jgi:hypothetical protein